MKPYQSLLTTLVILQVVSVLLLGAMAFLNYQGQTEVSQLRNDLVSFQEAWKQQADMPMKERLAALESRLGMRDPKADQTSAALQEQMAETSALQERFNELRNLPAPLPDGQRPPGMSGNIPAPSSPPTAAELPSPPPSPLAGLSPAEQAMAKLPVIAKISHYEPEWEFYTINKGMLDGVSPNQEFAVRRPDSYELLANVKVTSSQPEDAIVQVVRGTTKPGTAKPGIGDVLIDISKLQ